MHPSLGCSNEVPKYTVRVVFLVDFQMPFLDPRLQHFHNAVFFSLVVQVDFKHFGDNFTGPFLGLIAFPVLAKEQSVFDGLQWVAVTPSVNEALDGHSHRVTTPTLSDFSWRDFPFRRCQAKQIPFYTIPCWGIAARYFPCRILR